MIYAPHTAHCEHPKLSIGLFDNTLGLQVAHPHHPVGQLLHITKKLDAFASSRLGACKEREFRALDGCCRGFLLHFLIYHVFSVATMVPSLI